MMCASTAESLIKRQLPFRPAALLASAAATAGKRGQSLLPPNAFLGGTLSVARSGHYSDLNHPPAERTCSDVEGDAADRSFCVMTTVVGHGVLKICEEWEKIEYSLHKNKKRTAV